MIDLKNTYIKNEEGELRDLFVAECGKQGLNVNSERTLDGGYDYLEVYNGRICGTYHIEHNAKQLKLADFKPVKTVMDAVNKWGIDFPTSDETDDNLTQIIQAKKEFDGYETGELTNGSSVTNNEYWQVICTIEEFNQCVDYLEMFANSDLALVLPYDYTRHKLDNPVVEDKVSCPVCYIGAFPSQQYCGSCGHELSEGEEPKPQPKRMKIEYVKVVGVDIFDCIGLGNGGVHQKLGNGTFSELNLIDDMFTYRNELYRKVETEIKEEKRWIVYSPTGEFCSEHDYEFKTTNETLQVIEITIEV